MLFLLCDYLYYYKLQEVRKKMKSFPIMALFIMLIGTDCTGRTLTTPTREQDNLRVDKIGDMSVDRAAHQAVLLNTGKVLIIGGCGGTGCDHYYDSVELFDPSTRTFQPAASMSTPRAGHAAVILPDGKVLVCGGWTGQGATASTQIYDPATDQWTSVGDMNDARESLMAVPLPGGRVLVTGGSGGQDDPASAEIFDPATSTFSAVGPMSTNHYLATALADGRVLLTGGESEAGAILRSAEIFDPVTNEFQPTGEMTSPRVKHAGVLLPDGKVLIIGGSDTGGYSSRFSSTEIFDPKTGTFTPGPDLNFGRHKLRDAVLVLPSGAILIAGGAIKLELFDPEDQVFNIVEGELSGPQMFATTTVLSDENVLLLGGYDDHTRSSATAWLVHENR